MNVATKRVAGCSNSSSGEPICSRRPPVQDRDPVPELERLLLLVRHEERGDSDLADRSLQLAPRVLPQRGIEVGERLVEQQHAGARRQRPREGDALLLAARNLGDPAVLEAGQAGELEHLGDAASGFLPAPALRDQSEGHVLSGRHVRKERVMLEDHAETPLLGRKRRDVFALDEDAPRVGRLETGDEAQDGRLAAARGPEQGHDLAASGRQRHAARHRSVAETLLEVFERQETGHRLRIIHETGRASPGRRRPLAPDRAVPRRHPGGAVAVDEVPVHDGGNHFALDLARPRGQLLAEVGAGGQAVRLFRGQALIRLLSDEVDEPSGQLPVAAAGDDADRIVDDRRSALREDVLERGPLGRARAACPGRSQIVTRPSPRTIFS